MATPSYVEALIAPLEAAVRRSLKLVFDYVLTNLRFGQPTTDTRSENFQAYYYETTTDATANTEFSIAHGLGRAPYLLLPVLPLNTVGAQIVPLRVTRVADASRVYLSSSSTSATVVVLIEG